MPHHLGETRRGSAQLWLRSCRCPSFETPACGGLLKDEVIICGMKSDPHGEEARKRRLEP
jgi:hypothetical protein